MTPALAPAPWRDLFLEHVSSMPSPEFVLSTVHRVSSSSSSSPTTTSAYAPRARTCVFRGLWAELPAHPANGAPLNSPGTYASELPVFTTDARMAKVGELRGEEEEDGGEGKGGGTGGGAPVEAVWWAPAPRTQWRVRGRAYVLAEGDVEEEGAVVGALRRRMRRLSGGGNKDDSEGGGGRAGEEEWSFAREVVAHFGNLSPGMRGSFRNPPPGTPVSSGGDGGGLGLGQKLDWTDRVARGNFRVVVIVPQEVDRCDLTDPERGRRWVYRFVEEGGGEEKGEERIEGGWEVVEVWP